MRLLEKHSDHAFRHQTQTGQRIVLIDGHRGGHGLSPEKHQFGSALADAYAEGAYHSGWPLLRLDSRSLAAPAALDAIRWSSRLVLMFPLWGDQAPAPIQALFCRYAAREGLGKAAARTARMVITMDLPAFAHRAVLREGACELSRNLLLPGLESAEPLFIGSSDCLSPAQTESWLADMRQAGMTGR